jgi:aspartyl-tRNA(Asn)/glutamyl-tRNA(Gln) amidotransferase subunit A
VNPPTTAGVLRAPGTADVLADLARAGGADTELQDLLAAARTRPHPASPAAGPEPAAAEAFLRRAAADRAAGAPAPASTLTAPTTSAGTSGVLDLLAAFAAGTLDPRSVHDAAHATVVTGTGPVGTAFTATVAGSREAAAESAHRWAARTARPLEGVPFAVKEIVDVAGSAVTCGSLLTGDRVATTDATVVARLRAAGAVPVAMTATTEFACGLPQGRRHPAVQNPWRAGRWTGGSSTGSAAAVAARVVPFALGTDTGGSVRVPSSLCGLTGLKPTHGLVPRTGVATLSWTLDHVGPLARSAADVAAVLAVLAGPDGTDPTAVEDRTACGPADVADHAWLAGRRVGRVRGWFEQRCDAAVVAAADAAVDVLRSAGAVVVDVDLPVAERAYTDALVVLSCELLATQEAALDRLEDYDSGTRKRLARGATASAADYLRALRGRPVAQLAVQRAMDLAGVDVLLTPGVGATAPRLDDLTVDVDGQRVPLQEVLPRNTSPFNLTGNPALVLPAGRGADGLPVAVQLVGRPFDDALLLGLGVAFQRLTEHHLATPDLPA